MILVDISVLVRLNHPEVAEAFTALADRGPVARCGITDLQLVAGLVAPQRLAEVMAVWAAASAWLTTEDVDFRTALDVQATLVDTGTSVAWPCLVVAAVAHRHGATVLHYDCGYELIGKVTGQPTRWVAPPGTIA